MIYPDINSKFKLLEDWEFPLFFERRNAKLLNTVRQIDPISDYHLLSDQSIGYVLPKGTILEVTRVYIRSGYRKAWNSITFKIIDNPSDKSTISKSFWVKLNFVNDMVCELII